MLSVCIIAKNEEQNIGDCIKSARKVADEIILTDTGSTDHTVDIAKAYDVEQILSHKWHNHFADARNAGLESAKHGWILWIDADDRIPDESAEKINKLKHVDPSKKGVLLNMVNEHMPSKYIEERVFQHLKMFPNCADIRFHGRVHESVLPDIKKHKYNIIDRSDISILHTGYKDEATVKQHMWRNIKLQVTDMFIKADPSFDEMYEFYQFVVGEFYFIYAPNTMVMWDGLKMVGAIDPFEDSCPETNEERKEKIISVAKKSIEKYEAIVAETASDKSMKKMAKGLTVNA